ncbi:MAG: Uma2 family endonuclease [Armatimonadota bacterium]
MRSPLSLGESEPEPDVAIVPGEPGDYRDTHPTTAVLVAEVAPSLLEYDRQVKGLLYAGANIPEYWLVNLEERCVEVYRDPTPEIGYRWRRIYTSGETLSCLQKPDSPINVSDLLV